MCPTFTLSVVSGCRSDIGPFVRRPEPKAGGKEGSPCR